MHLNTAGYCMKVTMSPKTININNASHTHYRSSVAFIQRTALLDLMKYHVNLLAQYCYWVSTYKQHQTDTSTCPGAA